MRNHDPVNNPSHYNRGKIQSADFIIDQGLNFCKGNAVKYIVRAGHKNKDKEIEDLKKAIWYLNKEIETLERERVLEIKNQIGCRV